MPAVDDRGYSMPALQIVGDFYACGGQSGRHLHKQWTGWETSTQAMDSMGQYYACCAYHERLPHLLWMAWETSLPLHHHPVGASP